MTHRFAACTLLLATTAAFAGPVAPDNSAGAVREAPLLYVRVQGPAGMTVTYLEGASTGRTFDAPVTVGMRPLMYHRARLDGLPNLPGVSLYPSFEVRGTLCLPPRMSAADFPAPVVITENDIAQAVTGTFVTKVITLEDPNVSGGVPQVPGQPTEWEIAPKQDAIQYARDLGRPLLIVRLGAREPDREQRAQLRAGCILYPGELALAPLPASPSPTYAGYPGYPYPLPPSLAFGPRSMRAPLPSKSYREEGGEECLRDGGDRGTKVYLDQTGDLRGLDPSDTVATFKDSTGRRKIVPSNEVCVCVPRFIAVRQAIPLVVHDSTLAPFRMDGRDERVQLDKAEGTKKTRQLDYTPMMRGRDHLNANVVVTPQIRLTDIVELKAIHVDLGQFEYVGTDKLRLLTEEQKTRLKRQMDLAIHFTRQQLVRGIMTPIGTKAIGRVDNLGQVTGTLEVRDVTCLCTQEQPAIPEQPLHICKWASAEGAQIGDVITFTIRYSNLGGKPIKDIAISDNLTGRLEYIPGSAKSDRESVFVTQDNDAGSLILRWEIRDPLPPGQKGIVTFQARVR
jgi:uncharacterized repeat protein (TIGR01451 family)